VTMKLKDESEIWADILESPKFEKYIKMGFLTISIAAGIYLLGHAFKISAHTIRGFNELKSALKNG
jgi:hypothetical protein